MYITRNRLNALLDLQWSDIRSDDYLLDHVLEQIGMSMEDLRQIEDATADFKDCPINVFLEGINTEEDTARYSLYSDWVNFSSACASDEFTIGISILLNRLNNSWVE